MKLHAMQTYPEECCGVLMGRDAEGGKMICDILEVPNAGKENRNRRFLIGPEVYKKVEQEAAEEGVEIVGLYHSHPDHPAAPSEFDREQAMPQWSYVIVSVNQGQPEYVRSWVLREDRSAFHEEDIQVLDGQFKHHCK